MAESNPHDPEKFLGHGGQEDCYYAVRSALKKHFDIDPTSDQMNAFFFEVVDPPYNALRQYKRKERIVRDTLRAFKTMLEDVDPDSDA